MKKKERTCREVKYQKEMESLKENVARLTNLLELVLKVKSIEAPNYLTSSSNLSNNHNSLLSI